MKHVISIGIDNANGLTSLTAAASGAEDFDNWAKSQSYNTTLFTDIGNKSVYQNEIFNEINRIVEEKTCEQLIIFFSGHGILKSPNQEVWLLSNAKNNPNESINLTGSIDYARTTGIPYIVFISDACRILPTELQFTGNGSVIFPICNDTNEDSAIDVFYATRPGSPANEFNSINNSEKFGLFTKSLVELLQGEHPEIIYSEGIPLTSYYNGAMHHHYNDISIIEWKIDAINIEYPLKSLVAKKARNISVSLNQNPDIRIQYQNPKPYLSKFDNNTAKRLLINVNANEEVNIINESDLDISENIQSNLVFGLRHTNVENQSFKSILDDLSIKPIRFETSNIESELINNSEKIFDSTGRESFETQTGFTIVGNSIKDVVVSGNRRDLFVENGNEQIRIYSDDDISSALILLKNGESIPVAILKGFIGTMIFDKNRLLTINYTPSRNNYKYNDFKVHEKEINFVRAFVASAANEGFNYQKTFENEFNKDGNLRYDNPGSFLRREKSLDPSLGLYAVYAYMQAGKINDVKSVYRYMREERDNILFDVAMLSGKLNAENNRLASFCPMLSLGWAYRKRFEKYLHPQLIEASDFLVPNLYTTFDKKGTELILNLFKENIIK